MNGFKTGRLVEPKTQSFNDKVYAESKISFNFWSFWMGIKTKGGAWVYTSSGTKINFENWKKSKREKVASGDCAYSSSNGEWGIDRCNGRNTFMRFICEFV